MLVELQVFSGRPNPRWELDEQHARALVALQRALAASDRAPSVAPGLGYSGFSYTDEGSRVVAYDGYVHTARGVLDDPTRSVERFLLDQLPAEHAMLRDRVMTHLRRPRS